VPVGAGVYGETTVQKNITLNYLVNNDPDHCLVTECKILQDGVEITDTEFIWVNTEYLNINTDPKEEFYFNNL
jgi:hypothetical protein